jgi:hypothetical protein
MGSFSMCSNFVPKWSITCGEYHGKATRIQVPDSEPKLIPVRKEPGMFPPLPGCSAFTDSMTDRIKQIYNENRINQ